MTIRIRRWHLEWHRRAIRITREPDPNCASCNGAGGHGWITRNGDADWEECACLDQLRTWRLPLWPRRQYAEGAPF